jgi:hypothetical protein
MAGACGALAIGRPLWKPFDGWFQRNAIFFLDFDIVLLDIVEALPHVCPPFVQFFFLAFS